MKTSRIFICLIVLLGLSVERVAWANVVINEVAWMGTANSANAEWIELYNNGSDAAILDGWSLRATDGSPSIVLSGQVSAGGYFLLERTSDETVPGVTAGQVYSGSLGNTGEHLELKNNLDEIQDDVDTIDGWPAGDNTTKQTMNRKGSLWITADPTPGATNKEGAILLPQSSSATSSTGGVLNLKEETDSADVIEIKPDPKYSTKILVPDFSTAGTEVPLSVEVRQDSKRNMVDGRFDWYLGDGSGKSYLRNTPFNHVFYYAGEYTVVMEYYSNIWKKEPDSIHKKKIIVVPANISITHITDDGGVIFSNTASKEIDLAQWKLSNGSHHYVFPKYTIVPKEGTLSISSNTLGFKILHGDTVSLRSSIGTIITEIKVHNEE